MFGSPLCEIVARRASHRTYREAPEQAERLVLLAQSLAALPTVPFGSRVRTALIVGFDPKTHGVDKLGTYGVIRGAKDFLVGLMSDGPHCLEDMGYAFEWAVLTATDLGLQTCWLGATFRREAFAKAARANEGESVPVVSPVGTAAESRSLVDTAFRFLAGSKNRKPMAELFFGRDFRTPLPATTDPAIVGALEMVRLAPSASNQQPWRVLCDPHGRAYHFYLARTPSYRRLTEVDLQRIDIGIAICHFVLACREQGIAGTWEVAAPRGLDVRPGVEYVATFVL